MQPLVTLFFSILRVGPLVLNQELHLQWLDPCRSHLALVEKYQSMEPRCSRGPGVLASLWPYPMFFVFFLLLLWAHCPAPFRSQLAGLGVVNHCPKSSMLVCGYTVLGNQVENPA